MVASVMAAWKQQNAIFMLLWSSTTQQEIIFMSTWQKSYTITVDMILIHLKNFFCKGLGPNRA